MANTPFNDLTSEEIVSSRISGLQDAIKNVEQSLNMDTEAVENESLTLLADAHDAYRIAEAIGKRNWLTDPAPVIQQYIAESWTTIATGFTIDHGGGAVIFEEDKVGEQFRASFTRVKNTSGFQAHAFGLWGDRSGHRYSTDFNPDGSILEELRNTATNDLVASMTTTFNDPGPGDIKETLYVAVTGSSVAKVTTFNPDGSIAEEVSEVI